MSVTSLGLNYRYLTEALEKEKVIPKRVTKGRKKMMRSRRSRLADELVFLGRDVMKNSCISLYAGYAEDVISTLIYA